MLIVRKIYFSEGSNLNQTIAITVRDKIASTDFDEVVSFNSVYRLAFDFDEEWDAFPNRVAVVMWAGGTAEWLFAGNECDMPVIDTLHSEHALIGVYSVNGGKRIASSFVRVRCRAGACGAPSNRPVASLHEQILDFFNGKDWSVFEGKVAEGVYSAVQVDKHGLVKKGWDLIEVGADGQEEPSEKLADGGVFFGCKGGIYTPYYVKGGQKEALSLAADAQKKALHIGSKTYDGTEEVTITDSDLGLRALAKKDLVAAEDLASDAVHDSNILSGAVRSRHLATACVTPQKVAEGLLVAGENITVSRNGSSGVYTVSASGSGGGGESAVTSVNGQTGDVTITKNDLGLAEVAITGSYNDLIDKPAGGAGGGAVTSVNGQTGDVVIDAASLKLGKLATKNVVTGNDVQAYSLVTLNLADGCVQGRNIATGAVTHEKVASGLISDGVNTTVERSSLGVYRINAAFSGVTSVNGQKGDVTVSKNDLGLAEVAISGSYSDLKDLPDFSSGPVLSVNGQTGQVTITKNDLGLAEVAITGSYNDLTDKPRLEDGPVVSVNGQTGQVTITKDDLGLADVAVSGDYLDLKNRPKFDGAVLTVNGRTGNVVLTKNDFGLPEVAITGSYNDLLDKPDLSGGPVLSVNGQSGAVTITKNDLGLGLVTNDRQMPLDDYITGDLNKLTESGFYTVIGDESHPCTNSPITDQNPSGSDCRWAVLVIAQEKENIATQILFSQRSDCAVRMRVYTGTFWSAWKVVV